MRREKVPSLDSVANPLPTERLRAMLRLRSRGKIVAPPLELIYLGPD